MTQLAEISFHADRLLRRFRSRLHDRLLEHGLPIGAPDSKIMMTIAHRKGLAISELVTEVGRDKSQITRKVQELENKGLIARTADPQNARRSLLNVTDEGQKLIAALEIEAEEVMEELLVPLPDSDRQSLLTLLRAVSGSQW